MTPRAPVLLAPLLLAVLLFPVLLLATFAGSGATHPAAACGPGPATTVPTADAAEADAIGLSREQLRVATQAVAAVRRLPATADTPRAAVVVLATGYQESRLRNLDHGDRDSLGFLQQRPSQGWGSPAQVRNVPHATRSFLRRLLRIPRWETLRITDAAATVQRPAERYRGRYQQWVPLATALTRRLWGTATNPDPSAPVTGAALDTASPGSAASPAGCAAAGVGTVPSRCPARRGLAEAGLTADAVRVMRCALAVFGPHMVGGLGSRPNPSDHTTGRAVDIMIAGWDTPAGNAHGWQIARWVRDNARQLGLTYVIFDARIWSVQRHAEGWRPYSHPTGASSPTLDHLNHVHVSVHGDAGFDTPIRPGGDSRLMPGQARVASFNVLGHSHTLPGGTRPGMASGSQRIRWAIQLLHDNDVSVAGLQEFEPIQVHTFRNRVGATWGIYPGAGGDNANAIVWRTDTWERIAGRSYAIPYFYGQPRRMPVVLLRHRVSGRTAWFSNHHNPADARGPADRWRREATRREIAYTRRLLATGYPVVVTGDMNERARFFCRFTRGVPGMHAANGGSHHRGCHPPRPSEIDWILGSSRVTFTGYTSLRGSRVRRTTDHPLILASIPVSR